jgi:hypothetical protein
MPSRPAGNLAVVVGDGGIFTGVGARASRRRNLCEGGQGEAAGEYGDEEEVFHRKSCGWLNNGRYRPTARLFRGRPVT